MIKQKPTRPHEANLPEECKACDFSNKGGYIHIDLHTCERSKELRNLGQPSPERSGDWEERFEEFVGKPPVYHTPDHQNIQGKYSEKMFKIDELKSFIQELLASEREEGYKKGYARGRVLGIEIAKEERERILKDMGINADSNEIYDFKRIPDLFKAMERESLLRELDKLPEATRTDVEEGESIVCRLDIRKLILK